jgi:hypothetical protein
MSSQAGSDTPFVIYPPDAARPGYSYRDYYPDSPDPIYVPVPGDEGFVDQMTDLEIAERAEMSSAAQSDISQIAAGSSTSPAFPSFNSTTNSVRFGDPLSSTSVATPQFRLSGSLSSASVGTPHPSRGVISILSGNSSLSFASTTRATVVPPTRALNSGEVLPNFSAFQALGAGASAQPTTTQQIGQRSIPIVLRKSYLFIYVLTSRCNLPVCSTTPRKIAKVALTSLAGLRKTSALHSMRHFLR